MNPLLTALFVFLVWMSDLTEGINGKTASYTAATAVATIITCAPQTTTCQTSDLTTYPSSYEFQPPSRIPSVEQPLRYITPATLLSEGEDTAKAAFNEIKKAAMPKNIDTFVAIAAAETTAGVVGGISSRKVADALKDRKRDDLSTKALSSGAFFGTRGVFRTLLTLLGVPRPISILFSSLSASLVSEEAKFLSRERNEKPKVSEIKGSVNDYKNSDILSAGEIVSDVSKWLLYDFLVESTQRQSIPLLSAAQYFSFGSIAGTISFFIKEPPREMKEIDKEDERAYVENTLKASLEGGVLFLIFEFTLKLLNEIIPDQYNKEFLLSQIIDSLEDGQ